MTKQELLTKVRHVQECLKPFLGDDIFFKLRNEIEDYHLYFGSDVRRDAEPTTETFGRFGFEALRMYAKLEEYAYFLEELDEAKVQS